jgi:hypothetical protein
MAGEWTVLKPCSPLVFLLIVAKLVKMPKFNNERYKSPLLSAEYSTFSVSQNAGSQDSPSRQACSLVSSYKYFERNCCLRRLFAVEMGSPDRLKSACTSTELHKHISQKKTIFMKYAFLKYIRPV